jgi:hypothetical protein
MIAINVELGFRAIDSWRSWEVPVASMLGTAGATEPAAQS